MAFTINREPAKFSPIHNELTYKVTSTNYTQPQMMYIMKIYVEGVLVNTSKRFPLVNGTCEFNIQPILKNYIEVKWLESLTLTSPIIGVQNENIKYYVEFYEEYIVNNVLTTSSLLATSTTSYAFNMAADQYNTTLTTYMNIYTPKDQNSTTPFTANQSKFCALEKSPLNSWSLYNTKDLQDWDTYPINKNDIRTITYIGRSSDFTKYPNKMIVRQYLKAAQPLVNPSPEYNYTKYYEKWLSLTPSNVSSTYNLGHLGVGPSQLDAYNWNTQYGSVPILFNETTSYGYSVELVYSATLGTGSTNYYSFDPIVFKFQPDCYRYEHNTILYRSKNGGYGYIDMNMRNMYSEETNRNLIERKRNYTDAYYIPDKPVINILTTGRYTMNSDWLISDAEIREYMDMLSSPEIYIIQKGSTGLYNKYIPVFPLTNQYAKKKLKENTAVQYTVEFEESFNKKNII